MKPSSRQELISLKEVKETTLSLGLKPTHATFRRVARAMSMVKNVENIKHLDDHTYRVRSQRHDKLSYTVRLDETPSCTCEDWRKHSKGNGFLCKHVIAALLFEQREEMESSKAQVELLEQQFGSYLGSNTFVKWYM